MAWSDEGASRFLFSSADFYGAGTFCSNSYKLIKGSKVYDVVYLSGAVSAITGYVEIYTN